MIDIADDTRKMLNAVFDKYLPPCEIRVFGSRIKGTAKNYSDLDIAIVANEVIERRLFQKLKEEIMELPISFRVDILDWHKISPEFQKIIENNYEIL